MGLISVRNTVNISLCLGVSWKGNFSLGCCCAAGAGQCQPGQVAPSSGPVLINLGTAGHQQNEKCREMGLEEVSQNVTYFLEVPSANFD